MTHLVLVVTGKLGVKPESESERERAGLAPEHRDRSYIALAHAKARLIFAGTGLVTDLHPNGDPPTYDGAIHRADHPAFGAPMNGVQSFMVAPCGSKPDWEEEATHERMLDELLAWIDHQAYGDPEDGHPLEWVTVEYGRDDETVVAANVGHRP